LIETARKLASHQPPRLTTVRIIQKMKLPDFLKRLFSGSEPSSSQQPERQLHGTTRAHIPDATKPDNVPADVALAKMLENPEFLADPVFKKENYLQSFGSGIFRQLLKQLNKQELIERMQVSNVNEQMAVLMAGGFCCWAIDLNTSSANGVIGREEFLSRVSQPIRRPPPEMAAFTVEQHILAMGVAKIQIEDQPAVPGEYQICKLKTIGWYVAALASPQEN